MSILINNGMLHWPKKTDNRSWIPEDIVPIPSKFGVWLIDTFQAEDDVRCLEQGVTKRPFYGVLVRDKDVLLVYAAPKHAQRKKYNIFIGQSCQDVEFYPFTAKSTLKDESAMTAWHLSGGDIDETIAFLSERSKSPSHGYVSMSFEEIREKYPTEITADIRIEKFVDLR